MLNRRLIRIKAFKTLYAHVFSGEESVDAAVKNLMKACEMTPELYYFLLNITGSVTRVARERIEAGLRKFHPTEEEASPSYRFVDNRFTALLQKDPEFGRFCQNHALSWADHDVYVKKLTASILSSDYYREYITSSEDSFEADCLLWRRIFEEEFEDDPMLESIIEERSALWPDDICYVLNVIIRAIGEQVAAFRRTGLESLEQVLGKRAFIHPDDKAFARELLEESIAGHDEYSQLIHSKVENWDSQRLVSTDVELMVMGIAEAVHFPSIPVKATINEYVEISKFYSTANSHVFVNGILDKIIKEKIASGEIVKIKEEMMQF